MVPSFAASYLRRLVFIVTAQPVDREHCLAFLSVRLHIASINSRYLGAVRTHCSTPYWKLILLVGMISRRLKALVEEELRRAHRSASGDPARSNTKAFVEFLNHVFGSSEESAQYWQATLMPSVLHYFGPLDDIVLNEDFKERFFAVENDVILGEPLVLRLLKEFLKKINMELNPRTMGHYYDVNPRSILSVQNPFDTTGWLGFLSVIVFSQSCMVRSPQTCSI